MNVFEDLVVELKEANLLEDTVIDVERTDPSIDITDEPNPPSDPLAETIQPIETPGDDPEPDAVILDNASDLPPERPKKYGREFFNKRAIAEVSSLQMVEHVLTGVEREYMKIIPKSFDDFEAKKALNTFLQVPDSSNSEEHKKAEFDLMHETEAWASALGDRDRNIPVSSVRNFCENTRPALSSQALLALGRFYRNSPYSEAVRAKFDFVITRLFSRPCPIGRMLLFSREETLEHITKLYADWSSVPLYTADADDSKILLTALSFEDLATEAENASAFDQLITSDFFGRLRNFKESISEVFYAPNVTAAAIECNIRIGNAYVRLIDREHNKLDAGRIQELVSDVNAQTVSDAAGWTLDLAEIIRLRADLSDAQAETAPVPSAPETQPVKTLPQDLPVYEQVRDDEQVTGVGQKLIAQFKAVNKWVLITCVLLLMGAGGLWVWANYIAGEEVASGNVRAITVENTPLGEHLKTAKVSGDTYYGLLKESWDVLPKEKRVEFIQQCLASAQQQGARQVQLIDKNGRQAGYASATKVDVTMP